MLSSRRFSVLQQHLDVAFIIPVTHANSQEVLAFMATEALLGNGVEALVITLPEYASAFKEQFVLHPLVKWKLLLSKDAELLGGDQSWIEAIAPHLTYTHVLFCHPTTSVSLKVVETARWLLATYTQSFCVSTFSPDGTTAEDKAADVEFMLLPTAAWRSAGGKVPYGEKWHKILQTMCAQLQRTGWRKLKLPVAVPETRLPSNAPTSASTRLHNVYGASEQRYQVPSIALASDWQQHSLAQERCLHYLSTFPRWVGASPSTFQQHYSRIALLQTYNEARYFPEVLYHLAEHCDGIILLDDSSTDGTFDMAEHPKLLLKVLKPRTNFNDLQNRNILLDLASFFLSKWLVFMDADERIHPDFSGLSAWEHVSADTVGVWVVNLWDSELTFRNDLKDSSSMSQGGIWFRARMFRPNGRAQIKLSTARQLHFSPIPRSNKVAASNIVVAHYGTLEEKDRQAKFAFYEQEDKQREGISHQYEYLLEQNPALASVTDIRFTENTPSLNYYKSTDC